MSVSELGGGLRGAPIRAAAFAELSGFVLDSLHWDERAGAITAAFEGSLPGTLAAELGAEPDHDWIRFHLRFPEVEDVAVASWSHEPATEFTMKSSETRISVTISGSRTAIQFTTASVLVVQHRTSHASPA